MDAGGGDDMSLATTLNTLQRKPVMATGDMPISLETISGFENLQRMARMFVTVPFVPDTFRAPYTDEKGKRRGCSSIEEAIGCCVVALDMAMRMKANPLAVMQNIYVVHGRPAWTAQFLLATLNNSGRFSTIRYKFQGTQGKDDWGCRAVAKELTTGEIVEGPLITIGLAKHEGWFKNSSKWQSMPDLMLRYRAVSWFVRVHAPEIAMGLKTEDELRDTIELIPQEDGSWAKPVEEATPSTSVETIRESASPADRGQEDATSDTSAQDKAEARRKAQQELEDLRHEALATWEDAGLTLEAACFLAGSRQPEAWSKTDCKRIIKEAVARASAAAQEQPEAPQPKESPAPDSTQAGSADTAPEPEQAFVPPYQTFTCPHNGAQVTEDDCYDCKHRTGCPAHDDAPAADA